MRTCVGPVTIWSDKFCRTRPSLADKQASMQSHATDPSLPSKCTAPASTARNILAAHTHTQSASSTQPWQSASTGSRKLPEPTQHALRAPPRRGYGHARPGCTAWQPHLAQKMPVCRNEGKDPTVPTGTFALHKVVRSGRLLMLLAPNPQDIAAARET